MTKGPQRVFSPSRSDTASRCYQSGVHQVFVGMETDQLCKFVSLVMFGPGEHCESNGLQEQLSSSYSMDDGEFPEPLRITGIKQGVVLSRKP